MTLSGNASATVTLGLFYHIPGNSAFFDSGLRTTAVFSNSSTATYSFGSYTNASANTYRIQVTNSGGLGGSTVKSNSVPPCTGTPPPPPPPPPGPCSSTPGYTGPSTLGLCQQGSIPDVTDANSPNGSQVTVGSQNETVTSVCGDVVAVDPVVADDQYSIGIYTDAGGAPGTLVATSPVETMTAAGWNCAPISAVLSANTPYWLMFYSNANDGADPGSHYGDLYYNSVGTSIGAFSNNFTTPGAPISWANYTPNFGPSTVVSAQYSIYANVNP